MTQSQMMTTCRLPSWSCTPSLPRGSWLPNCHQVLAELAKGDASPYEMHSQVKEPFSFAVQVPTVTLGAVTLGKGLSLHLHAAEAMETVIIIAPRGAFMKGFDVLEE